jgi:hypothetical protein
MKQNVALLRPSKIYSQHLSHLEHVEDAIGNIFGILSNTNQSSVPTQHNISRLHPSSDSGIFSLAIHYHSVNFDHYALTNDMNR